MFLAYAALVAQFQGIQIILVPALVQKLAPTTKVSTLAALFTASAATALIAMLISGIVSDRTRTHWGKRTPWLVCSCAIGMAIQLLMGLSTHIWQLFLLMPLGWFFTNYYQIVLIAILPDRVSQDHRGFVAAAISLGVPAGIFIGVNIASLAPNIFLGYTFLAAFSGVATTALVTIDKEGSNLELDRTSISNVTTSGLFSALRSRDFTLTFLSRLAFFLSYFMVAGFLLYVMQDYVGPANLPGGSPSRGLSIVLSICTICWVLVTPITAVIADRLGRTAAIVGVTSGAMGLVMLIMVIAHTWAASLLFGAGLGVTFGIYFALDLKLASLVMPSAAAAGRDMGLMGIAATGPTVLAPVFSGAVIAHSGYPALFIVGAALALCGGGAAFLVRARG
jgi:MFS family permease